MRARLHAADALRAGDCRGWAGLMAQSHASMRDDFEITLPAIDRLVAILAERSAMGRRADDRRRLWRGGGGGDGAGSGLMRRSRRSRATTGRPMAALPQS